MPPIEESVFNNVIKKVKKIPAILEDESVVRINMKTLKFQEKPIVSLLIKKFWTYVVGTSGTSRHIANGTTKEFEIKDHLTDRGLAIYFRYKVSCPDKNKIKLVESLAGEESPEHNFEKIIDTAIQKLINGDESIFLDKFSQHQLQFTQQIKQELSERTGLNVNLTLSVKYEDTLCPIQFNNLIPVRLLNNNAELNTKLFFELSVISKNKLDAAINFRKEYLLEEKVVELVCNFFKENITFNEFYYGIDDLSLGKLTQSINHVINSKGREVSILQIDPVVPNHKATEFESLKFELESIPHLSQKKVIIINDLQFELVDPKKFIGSKITDFNGHVEELLRRIIKQKTFGKTYLDFLLHFSRIEEKIEMEMKKSLYDIGYDLKQLISGPTLPETAYLQATPYSYSFKKLPTKSANIFVNFNVSITYSFSSFKKIKHYLNKNIPIEFEIETRIKNYLETTLNSKAPEDIYMKFSTELEPELIKGIKKIVKKYRARLSGKPVIKQEQTDIGDFVRGLMYQSQEFEISLQPLGGIQQFTFNGQLTIVSVEADGWDRLSKMNFDFDKILNVYKNAIKSKFEAIEEDRFLAYATNKGRNFLEKVANTEPVMTVAKRFGVIVQVDNLNRERTAMEMEAVKIRHNAYSKSIEEDDLVIKNIGKNTQAENDLLDQIRKDQLFQLQQSHQLKQKLMYSDDPDDEDQVAKAEQIIGAIESKVSNTKTDNISKIAEKLQKKHQFLTTKENKDDTSLESAFFGADNALSGHSADTGSEKKINNDE